MDRNRPHPGHGSPVTPLKVHMLGKVIPNSRTQEASVLFSSKIRAPARIEKQAMRTTRWESNSPFTDELETPGSSGPLIDDSIDNLN